MYIADNIIIYAIKQYSDRRPYILYSPKESKFFNLYNMLPVIPNLTTTSIRNFIS